MRPAILAFSIAASLVLHSAGARCESIKKDYHETFKVTKDTVLRLESGDGEVQIRKWDRDEIDVTVHYVAEFKSLGSGTRDFSVDFRERKDIIEIIGRERSTVSVGFHIFDLKKYTYTIKAPAYLALELEGDDGSIDMSDWKGDVSVRMDDGKLTMSGMRSERTNVDFQDGTVEMIDQRGEVEISGDDGTVRIERSELADFRVDLNDGTLRMRDCTGPVDAETDDGTIDISDIKSNSIYLVTNDGTIRAELLDAGRIDADIRSDDGDITLMLEKGISAEYSIDAEGGDVSVAIPDISNLQKGRHWQSGVILDGKGKIRIRTGDGTVRMRSTR